MYTLSYSLFLYYFFFDDILLFIFHLINESSSKLDRNGGVLLFGFIKYIVLIRRTNLIFKYYVLSNLTSNNFMIIKLNSFVLIKSKIWRHFHF